MNRLPNAIFIGAPKTGSTWLHRVLEVHPDCYTLPSKGADFFDKNWQRGIGWYSSRFGRSSDEAIAIDISHDYLYGRAVPRRLEQVVPEARLLAFVREPIDRLESEIQFARRSGYRRQRLDNILETLVRNSHYAMALRHWQDALAAQRLRVFFYDDLQVSARDFWSAISTYLGISSQPGLRVAEEHHLPASAAHFPRATWHLRRGGHWLRDRGAGPVVDRLKRSHSLDRVMFRSVNSADYFHFDEGYRESLVNALRPDVYELDAMLDGAVAQRWPVYWS